VWRGGGVSGPESSPRAGRFESVEPVLCRRVPGRVGDKSFVSKSQVQCLAKLLPLLAPYQRADTK
jgi:hypothetical protein